MSYIDNGYELNGYRGETTLVPCLADGLPSISGRSTVAMGHEYAVPYTVFGEFPDAGNNTATSMSVVAGTSLTPPTEWSLISEVPEFKLWSDAAQGRDFILWGSNCSGSADFAASQADTYTTGWTTGKPRLAVMPAMVEIGVSGFAIVDFNDLVAFCDDPTATVTVTVGAEEKYSAVYGGNETSPFVLADCNGLGMITVDIEATNGVGTVALSTFALIMDNNGNCGPS